MVIISGKRYQALVRVARAAKLYLEHGEPCLADELEEYLKEVEPLLEHDNFPSEPE